MSVREPAKKVFFQFGVFGALLLALVLLMVIIVFPIVAFAKNATLLYSIITILLMMIASYFLVVRKYRNLIELELANTRDNKEIKSISRTLIFKILIKPILVVFIIGLYGVVFYTFSFSIIVPSIALFLLTYGVAYLFAKKAVV